jgi:hypothetical protein
MRENDARHQTMPTAMFATPESQSARAFAPGKRALVLSDDRSG